MNVEVTGELRPPEVIALDTAVEMCREAGWDVASVVVHRVEAGGVALWVV